MSLKIDGEVGDKKRYDPRAWGKAAESAMSERVTEACEVLGSAGQQESERELAGENLPQPQQHAEGVGSRGEAPPPQETRRMAG